jgi:hypothetical protein
MKPGILALCCSLAALAGCGARSDLPGAEAYNGGGGASSETSCTEAGVTYIYAITDQQKLHSFDPATGAWAFIGDLRCAREEAYSMAVDRRGRAYVELHDGRLFVVSTASASCSRSRFRSRRFEKFGMGFSADVADGGETLFLATPEGQLGRLDVSTFQVTTVGFFSRDIGSAELTGTGDGKLFAFGIDETISGAHLAEIDKSNADVLSSEIVPLETVGGPTAWAFAHWGGAFYFFTSEFGAPSAVTRYDPAAGTLEVVSHAEGVIVGAGVSTCAPTE